MSRSEKTNISAEHAEDAACVGDLACGCGHAHGHDGHGHAHGHGDSGVGHAGWLGLSRLTWIEGAVGLVLYVTALLVGGPEWLRTLLFGAAWFAFGREVLLGAIRGLAAGRWFDEFFLMTIASFGAFAIGEHPEAVAVMLFYRIGEALQDAALDKSKDSIRALMAIRPDTAWRLRDGEAEAVPPEAVAVGDLLLVKPGGRVPVDGVVVEGQAALDLSALTGESLPRHAGPGDEVLSGSISTDAALTISALRPYGESAVGRILQLVETASARKARAEKFVTRFSKVYTPIVTGAAFLLAVLPPLLVPGQSFSVWLYRALVFLVVSCPCALVVSIPLGFYGGIGGAARRGILVKGGQYLEALHRVDTVVFDKTGTLTEGRFTVVSVHAAPEGTSEPAEGTLTGQAEREVLRLAALAERQSTHPLAVSILRAWGAESPGPLPDKVREHAGRGIEAWIGERRLVVGQAELLHSLGIDVPDTLLPMMDVGEEGAMPHLILHMAENQHWRGSIRLEDTPRAGVREAVAALRDHGIRNVAMLTGDGRHVAGHVATHAGVDTVHAELLPHQKVERLEAMMAEGRKAAFVGDGINDAPVLVRADVGIAMGGIGSDAAMEAADIVLMRDDPALVAEAIRIARKTRRVVMQNIVLALGVKGLVLLLGAGGLATMWEAVFADVGVALLAILNAMRVLKK